MTRILMFVRFYYPHSGGNETQCRLLSEYLASFDYTVTVLTERYSTKLARREMINGVNIIRLNSFNTLNSHLRKRRWLIKLLKINKFIFWLFKGIWFYLAEFSFLFNAYFSIYRQRKSFDILHIHQYNWIALFGVAAARISGKKMLIKDATLNGFSELNNMPFSRSMRRYIVKHGFFVAISSDIKYALINQGIDEEKIASVPNGVNLPKNRNYYDITNNELLFIGNFWQGECKGLDVLLTAIEMLSLNDNNFKLLILGEGDSLSFEKHVKEKGLSNNIIFLGKQQVEEFLLRSFIFVLPSRSEGMSNALLEAMAYGMPCISTKVSGSKDIIKDKINGLLVGIEDPDAIKDAIIYLFANRAKAYEMGLSAMDTIRNQYRMDIIGNKYIEIYESLEKLQAI